MVLILDNYDSFTYNLYQIVGSCKSDVKAIYSNRIGLEDIEALRPSHLVLSHGPGRPKDAGICAQAANHFAGRIPILGVGLGHHAICEAFGGTITRAPAPMHGKKSVVHIANGNPIFQGLPPLLEAGQYRCLTVDRGALPEVLLVIAESTDGEIMGIGHRDYDVFGLQFHPESILTPMGGNILENFLRIGGQGK